MSMQKGNGKMVCHLCWNTVDGISLYSTNKDFSQKDRCDKVALGYILHNYSLGFPPKA
jgi:hypothetical protein